MNMVEYFEKEAKKSKGYPNALERVSKAIGKTGCVVKTVCELAFSLRQVSVKFMQSFRKEVEILIPH